MIPAGIELDHEYFIVELNTLLPPRTFAWLIDNLGDSKDGRWVYHSNKLYFKDPKDHLMFVIRWP